MASASAVARPIPLEAPVMTATDSLTRMAGGCPVARRGKHRVARRGRAWDTVLLGSHRRMKRPTVAATHDVPPGRVRLLWQRAAVPLRA